MIEELHHVQIAMPRGEEDVARDFFARVLLLPEVDKPNALHGRGGVWFETAHVRLHIGVEEAFTPARKAHPAFRVRSLADAIAHLKAEGVAYQAGTDLPGIRRIYLKDPFGNRIELLEQKA